MLVKDAARIAAESVLKKHWDGSFPVDPVAIAEKLDLTVNAATFSSDISGAIISENGRAVIYVSDSEALERQTFTCAHELGHYFERREANDEDYSFTDLRGGEYDLHEFYADEFAGNLLMPEDKFLELYKENPSSFFLASYFAVSPSAVRKRVERLRKDRKL